MSERTSTGLFVGEFLIVVLPLLLLAMVGLPVSLMPLQILWRVPMSLGDVQYAWPDVVGPLLACAAVGSFGCGLFLTLGRIRSGRRWFASTPDALWRALWIGYVLIAAAWISLLAPPSPEYGAMWSFREQLERLAVASPLIVPALHLHLEARWAAGAN